MLFIKEDFQLPISDLQNAYYVVCDSKAKYDEFLEFFILSYFTEIDWADFAEEFSKEFMLNDFKEGAEAWEIGKEIRFYSRDDFDKIPEGSYVKTVDEFYNAIFKEVERLLEEQRKEEEEANKLDPEDIPYIYNSPRRYWNV